MQLRKDPITRSWVITGDDPFIVPKDPRGCPYCADTKVPMQVVASQPGVDGAPWSARSVVHPQPIFHVEGDPQRSGEGLYDKMQSVGAHEILVENPKHDQQLWEASDAQIEQFLQLIASRILDLKRDPRFKYVTVFKNFGSSAGQDFDHPVAPGRVEARSFRIEHDFPHCDVIGPVTALDKSRFRQLAFPWRSGRRQCR
jgi:UDPglucose--hexose-1-phosphate uridylyltransferase